MYFFSYPVSKQAADMSGFSQNRPNNPSGKGVGYQSVEKERHSAVSKYQADPVGLKPSHEVLFITNLINQVFTSENLAVWADCMQSSDGKFLGPTKDWLAAGEYGGVLRVPGDGGANADNQTKKQLNIAISMVRVATYLAQNELYNLMRGAALVQGNVLLGIPAAYDAGGADTDAEAAGSPVGRILGGKLTRVLWSGTVESEVSKHWRTKYGNTWAGADAAAEDVAVQTASNQYRTLMSAFGKAEGGDNFATFLPNLN